MLFNKKVTVNAEKQRTQLDGSKILFYRTNEQCLKDYENIKVKFKNAKISLYKNQPCIFVHNE